MDCAPLVVVVFLSRPASVIGISRYCVALIQFVSRNSILGRNGLRISKRISIFRTSVSLISRYVVSVSLAGISSRDKFYHDLQIIKSLCNTKKRRSMLFAFRNKTFVATKTTCGFRNHLLNDRNVY